MKISHLALFLAAALVSCATTRNDSIAESSARTAAAAQVDTSTQSISEKEFKALHTLRADAPEAHTGTMIEIAGTRAYLALADQAASKPGEKPQEPKPGIVMIHEWWGLNGHIMNWADRLAREGYTVVAVDLYGGKVATTPDAAMESMKGVKVEEARATMRAAHRFLSDDPRVKAPKTASIGWCFGGKMSLELALAEPELDAAVMYYGKPITDVEALKPMQAALLGIFGTRDPSIPNETVQEFDMALTKAEKEHKILTYDAEHAFANPSSARYDEKSASLAWEEVRKFLAAKLKP
jgi:carboxymethylenebutenolidase